MIRTSFFERFNFARENSHILINPVRAELAHAFQKIEQKCKNQYRKVAVFYYFLGYNEMQQRKGVDLHQILLCEADKSTNFYDKF